MTTTFARDVHLLLYDLQTYPSAKDPPETCRKLSLTLASLYSDGEKSYLRCQTQDTQWQMTKRENPKHY